MTNELQDVDAVIRLNMTRDIVVAAASSGAVTDLAAAIAAVHAALVGLGGTSGTAVEIEVLKPAVPVNRSVRPEAIYCIECGAPHTSIKRHLRVAHGLTPEQYREKWSLRPDYPMVTVAYSEKRSQLAKDRGLGRK